MTVVRWSAPCVRVVRVVVVHCTFNGSRESSTLTITDNSQQHTPGHVPFFVCVSFALCPSASFSGCWFSHTFVVVMGCVCFCVCATPTGTDVTITAFSRMVGVALEAADALAKEGIKAEVINLRTIRPLDRNAIISSVKKTNR